MTALALHLSLDGGMSDTRFVVRPKMSNSKHPRTSPISRLRQLIQEVSGRTAAPEQLLTAGTIASERQLTGIINLDESFKAVNSADQLSNLEQEFAVDLLPQTGIDESTSDPWLHRSRPIANAAPRRSCWAYSA
jgi:hypothetical protein